VEESIIWLKLATIGTCREDSMKTVAVIPQLHCPECNGIDVRLFTCDCPGYYNIRIIFVCFECKTKFARKVFLENTYQTQEGICKYKLSSECWGVQVWGTVRCEDCEYKGTEDCEGQEILRTGKNEKGYEVGRNGI